METLDWSTFNKRIHINASPDILFSGWTTQENLEKWFLKSAQFFGQNGKSKDKNTMIEPRDTYIWKWHGSDFIAEGEVLKNNGKDYLEFTFLGCEVSVAVKTEEDENVLEIVQKKIPLDEESKMNLYVGCSRGWTFYATNLKSILEGGIDLRNKNTKLVNVINT